MCDTVRNGLTVRDQAGHVCATKQERPLQNEVQRVRSEIADSTVHQNLQQQFSQLQLRTGNIVERVVYHSTVQTSNFWW